MSSPAEQAVDRRRRRRRELVEQLLGKGELAETAIGKTIGDALVEAYELGCAHERELRLLMKP